MARYTGPVCKQCRREKQKLFLKGQRCYTQKCGIEKKPYPPGLHGRARIRESEYLIQLREKQKARRFYGVLEKQFRLYYREASKSKGITGEELLALLERRLDNVVYRAGFAASRRQARQLVNHGHFRVNGRKVTVPSYRLRVGDVVEARESSRNLVAIRHAVDTSPPAPEWLQADGEVVKIEVTALPKRSQIEAPVQESLIVELYSK
ncbi:MAG: 30S ribosomal protein S4 [Acidimicrobiia bacterium]